MNARIRNLDRPVQPLRIPGRQGIHHHKSRGMGLLHNAPDDLQRLHASLGHDPRHDGADPVHLLSVKGSLPVLVDDMPGNAQVSRHLRAQRVRRHLPVATPHHQHRQLLLPVIQKLL